MSDDLNDRLYGIFREHPALLVSALYVAASVVGMFWSWAYLRVFGINVFNYAQVTDFLIASLKEPFTWVLVVLAILMVSSVPYLNGKQFRLNKRQPLWILLAGIVLLNFAIARWQLFFFLGATGYVVSGPALWLWRKGRDEGSNGDSGEGDAGAAGGSGGGSSPTLTATAG